MELSLLQDARKMCKVLDFDRQWQSDPGESRGHFTEPQWLVICCWLSLVIDYLVLITSSTAQGGGGSFKNRKPIGEIGCCESRMAERMHWWTESCLRSLLFLSLSLTIYLPTYLSSMYLSIYRSIYLSLSLSSNYLSIYLSVCLSISLSLFHLSICLAVYLSICLSIYLSVCLSVYLSICGAVSFSVM